MVDCIKTACIFYHESDGYFEICELANKPCHQGKCIGLQEIVPAKEKITCKISTLLNQYNELCNVEYKISK